MTSLRKKEREYSALCRKWPRGAMYCKGSRSTLDWSGRRSDDEFKGTTMLQVHRVIVNVHREQARSYRKPGGVVQVITRVRIAA
jgi:hypothetical protein